jgi:hypothetical protein
MLWPDLITVIFVRFDEPRMHKSDPSIAVTYDSEGNEYWAQSKSGSFYALCRQIASLGAPLSRQTVLYNHDGVCAFVPKPLGYWAQFTCRESADRRLKRVKWKPHKLHAKHGDVKLKEMLDAWESERQSTGLTPTA